MTDAIQKTKLLFIIQRYGMDVDGGAELYCRWLAEHCQSDFDVTVATTCAQDYVTWENSYPSGACRINGVPVMRFPVDYPRKMECFNAMTESLLARPVTSEDEQKWLLMQGPISHDLIQYLKKYHTQYDALLFFTYLYYPTVEGSKINPEKSILIPTAHNEPVAHFSIYHELYRRVKGLLYLTKEEQSFVQKTYPVCNRLQVLLGTGVEIPEPSMNSGTFLEKYGISQPYILYIGRVEAGKGCTELIDFFTNYLTKTGSKLSLIFAGKNRLDQIDHEQIRFLGYIPDEDIKPALDHSALVVVPSPFESLSILLLQGLLAGKPVLANGRCPVLVDHCEKSNAGLYYTNEEEFVMALRLLESRADFCQKLGVNGEKYVRLNYMWPQVIEKLRQYFSDFITINSLN